MPKELDTTKKKKTSSSDDEYYEPDEEELEEERQDAATKVIQGLFRAKRARYVIRELVKTNFVKEVDSLTGEHIYRNRRTGNISRRKPVFLGNDDLETPRLFASPGDYDPGQSSVPQFALVITNRMFESPKIPDIPEQVEGDHDALRETLEHPYFCKFNSENCFFVKNANYDVFVASLRSIEGQVAATIARLKKESERRARALRKGREARVLERKKERMVARYEETSNGDSSDTLQEEGEEEKKEEEEEEFDPKNAQLLVYICTHVAEITRGKGIAGTYLVASNTSWKSKEELAKTAVLLDTFAEVIAGIQVRQKIVFLDVVHTEHKHGGFKTRHLHPPRDLYDTAARLCDAVVVGSCRIGGTRELDLHVVRKKATSIWDAFEVKGRGNYNDNGGKVPSNSSNSSSGVSRGRGRSDDEDIDGSTSCDDDDDDDDADSSTIDERSSNDGGSSASESLSDRDSESSSNLSSGDNCIRRGFDGSDAGALDQNRTGKQSKAGHQDIQSQKENAGPSSPVSGYLRPESTPGRGSAQQPSHVFGKSLLASSGFGGISIPLAEFNIIKKGQQQYDPGTTRACVSTYDRAIYENNMSAFGRTIRDALQGLCSENVHLSRVLAVHLFSYVRQEFIPFERVRALETGADEEIEIGGGDQSKAALRKKKAAVKARAKKEEQRRAKLRAKASAEEVRLEMKAAQLKEAEEEKRRRTQLPVFAGPSISAIVQATVCAAPSPPPPPLVPFPIYITRTALSLTWENPSFAGEAPTSYEAEEKGSLRNNETWTPVFPPWYPTILSRPLDIPHRVPGLRLKYRVRACNHGGWGGFSDPTELIQTKAWLEDTGGGLTVRAMKELMRSGGARLVLARMKRYSSALLVQESGFHQLVAEFNKGGGVQRASLAQEMATIVADAMTTFSQVQTIQASGLLLLGWAARGKGEGNFLPADLIGRCRVLVTTAEKLHSMDVAIKGNAMWARFNLQMTNEGAIVACETDNKNDNTLTGGSSLEEEEEETAKAPM